MKVFWLISFLYTLSFMCLLDMFWNAYKGDENRADMYGAVGVAIALITTIAGMFYLEVL